MKDLRWKFFTAPNDGSRVQEVADLVPFMLEAFLDGDADFKRASRAGGAKAPMIGTSRRPNKSRGRAPGRVRNHPTGSLTGMRRARDFHHLDRRIGSLDIWLMASFTRLMEHSSRCRSVFRSETVASSIRRFSEFTARRTRTSSAPRPVGGSGMVSAAFGHSKCEITVPSGPIPTANEALVSTVCSTI